MSYVKFFRNIALILAVTTLVACGGGGSDSDSDIANNDDIGDGSLSQNELALLTNYRGVWTSNLCENREREAIYVTDDRLGYGTFEYDDFNCTELLTSTIGVIADPLSSWASSYGDVYTFNGVESFTTESGLSAIRIDIFSNGSTGENVVLEFGLFKDPNSGSLYVSQSLTDSGVNDVDLNMPFTKVENDYSNFIDTLSGTYTSACLAGNSGTGKLGEDGDGFFYKKSVTINGTPLRVINPMYAEHKMKYMDSECAGARENIGSSSCTVLFAREPQTVDGVQAYPVDCMRGNINPIYDLYYLNNDGSISRARTDNIKYPSTFDDYFRLYPET